MFRGSLLGVVEGSRGHREPHVYRRRRLSVSYLGWCPRCRWGSQWPDVDDAWWAASAHVCPNDAVERRR